VTVILVALLGLIPAGANATVAFTTAPNVPNFATVTLNGQAQTPNATMANWGVLQATTQSGWNVTVQGDTSAGKSAVFKVYCPNTTCGTDIGPAYVTGGRTLVADSLKLNSTGATFTGGIGLTKPTHSCNAGCNVDSATAVKIASAGTAVSLTTWTSSSYSATSLALTLPTTIRAPLQTGEIYHLDLIWTLNTGP
jgi:hypothetical protein